MTYCDYLPVTKQDSSKIIFCSATPLKLMFHSLIFQWGDLCGKTNLFIIFLKFFLWMSKYCLFKHILRSIWIFFQNSFLCNMSRKIFPGHKSIWFVIISNFNLQILFAINVLKMKYSFSFSFLPSALVPWFHRSFLLENCFFWSNKISVPSAQKNCFSSRN